MDYVEFLRMVIPLRTHSGHNGTSGKRVIATNNGQTTLFIGGHYEVNTTMGEITKYYMAGASHIAARKMIVPSSKKTPRKCGVFPYSY
jgi:hypothetical protein